MKKKIEHNNAMGKDGAMMARLKDDSVFVGKDLLALARAL